MSYVILVPLLPLLAALLVWMAGPRLRERGVRLGALPIIAAFAGAVVTLVLVSSQGSDRKSVM